MSPRIVPQCAHEYGIATCRRTRVRATDSDLVAAVRRQDRAAFDELWRRHSSAVRRAVAHFTNFDADDVTAEAFTRTLATLHRGHGPTDGFRAYVLTAARNIASEWARKQREVPIDACSIEIEDEHLPDFVGGSADNAGLAGVAFARLPERWQRVLWFTEVEHRKPSELAPELGLSANSVAALALRAREGLRREWVLAHLHPLTRSNAHEWFVERAANYARGMIKSQDAERIERHLTSCGPCQQVYETISMAVSEFGQTTPKALRAKCRGR